MKNSDKKLIILSLMFWLLGLERANAVFKLDFITPGTDAAKIVQMVTEKAENAYTKVLEVQNQKILAAGGAEGSALYEAYVKNPAAALFEHSAGQLTGNNSSASVLDVLKDSVKAADFNIADLERRRDDFIQAGEAAKMKKYEAMKVQKNQLEAEWSAVNDALKVTPNNKLLLSQQDELSKQIAELDGQMRMVLEEDVKNTDLINGLNGEINVLRSQVNELKQKLEAEKTLSFLDKEAQSFDATDEDAVGELYDSNIYRFFISDEDLKDTQKVAAVKLERSKEYYRATKHMWDNVASTYINLTQTDEMSRACSEASVKADSIFGAQAMQICADLQNAKAAAQYMEMMLAELRFDSIMQIQNWNDKLQLRDSSHDVTKFNLDYYKLDKKDVKAAKKALKEAKRKAKKAAQDAVSKQAKNLLK